MVFPLRNPSRWERRRSENQNRAEMAPCRTNLTNTGSPYRSPGKLRSRTERRGDVCYKYTKPVISSLMTIYLVFCKSKAKYHGALQPVVSPAPGRQQRLPTSGSGGVPGGLAAEHRLRLHRSLKYLIYDNAPAKLLISGGKGPTAKTHEAEGLVEFQERTGAQPFTSPAPRTLAKQKCHKGCSFQVPGHGPEGPG